VPESFAHRLESAPRPDLPLLELLHGLSGGLRLPDELGAVEAEAERRLAATVAREFPESGQHATATPLTFAPSRSPSRGARSSPAMRSWPTSSAAPAFLCTRLRSAR
jgi:hypothetical protein